MIDRPIAAFPRRSSGFGVALLTLLLLCPLPSAFAENFSFSADSMSGTMAKGRERTILVGKARVVSGQLVIEASRIELFGEDFRFAECTGTVSIVDKERGIRLSTGKLLYDRIDRIARLTGPSIMEDQKNGVVIKGDFIENDDKREIAIIQVNVRILKKELVCRAEFARYDRAAKILELSGSPYVRRDRDDYRAARILVNLDTEDITLEGSVSGTVVQKEASTPGTVTAGTGPASPGSGSPAQTGADGSNTGTTPPPPDSSSSDPEDAASGAGGLP